MARPAGRATDELYELREKKRDLERQVKAVEEQMEELETELIGSLDEQESTMSRGKTASASITESIIPIIEDIEAFHQYMLENEALHLLQNRPAVGAFRELLDAGETIPGLSPMTKRKISLRKLSTLN